ncbi:transketolase [Candidatus Uhrbacteria bacterium]|nr:transketolase [Candidatus Uhrbacteria bacterium]MBD3284157.1 transketolase [Candidatus Uhrbacteria bacterium]
MKSRGLTVKELRLKANEIRQDIIEMLLSAGSGHSAGPLGMADVFTALYFEIANFTPENRKDPGRDRIVLSNAHICPLLYAVLANRGYFRRQELLNLRKLGSPLQGHSNNHSWPRVPIETCGGPLGQGLSQAVGFALASRMNEQRNRANQKTDKELPTWHTWAMLSDGELNEGQSWEAIMLAGKHDLREVTAFVDRNNIQIDGFTEDVMPLEPLAQKFQAFNWSVIEVDGHNMKEIINAANKAKAIYENPTVILCHTIPGKGVDFMEWKYEWHGKPPKEEEAAEALKELRNFRGHLKSEHE